jgi:hypothetical protein
MPRGAGWFATHQWPEGQRKTQAKRKADEPPDDDDKQIECPLCGGSGEDEDGEACERCEGEGSIENPNPDARSDDEETKAMLESLTAWDKAVHARRQRTGESLAVASLRVGEENPGLYAAVQEEREDFVLTGKRRRAYVEALQARFSARGMGAQLHVHSSILPMR